VDIKPAFEDCYKLAVMVPTPLWISPVFLFIPSFIFNLTIGAVVLICRQLAQLLPRYAVYRDIRKFTRGGVSCLNFICPDCPRVR
jgi:hypothetical protein